MCKGQEPTHTLGAVSADACLHYGRLVKSLLVKGFGHDNAKVSCQ